MSCLGLLRRRKVAALDSNWFTDKRPRNEATSASENLEYDVYKGSREIVVNLNNDRGNQQCWPNVGEDMRSQIERLSDLADRQNLEFNSYNNGCESMNSIIQDLRGFLEGACKQGSIKRQYQPLTPSVNGSSSTDLQGIFHSFCQLFGSPYLAVNKTSESAVE